MRTAAPLLAPIFRSDGQARLLAALLLAGDELSITDVADRADLAYPTAHREVARLIDAGILVERQVGRTRLIRGNPDSPLAAPLREILTIVSGPVALLAEEFRRIDGIQSAFLYGSFAARLKGIDGPAPRHRRHGRRRPGRRLGLRGVYARRGCRASSGQPDDPHCGGVRC